MNTITFQSKAQTGETGAIKAFRMLTQRPLTFTLLEFELAVPSLPPQANVYDENDVAVTLQMTSATGCTVQTDGFYFEEYLFSDTLERLGRADTEPTFRIRVSPPEPGEWQFTVILRIGGAVADTLAGCFTVEPASRSSRLLRVEPTHRRNFVTADGTVTPLIGENVGWNYPIEEHGQWTPYLVDKMERLAANGGNYMRVWNFLESGSAIRKTTCTMRQESSAMWDRLFEQAAAKNVYISFVFAPHGEASQLVNSAWYCSVWNRENGGFLEKAVDFFSHRPTIDAFKLSVRYIVSRWGYNEQVIWELFNEIDHTDAMIEGPLSEVQVWLKEIADYVRRLDPYGHLLSNSTGGPGITPAIHQPFDCIYYHLYNNANVSMLADMQQNAWRTWQKPVIIGEAGFDGPSENAYGGFATDDLTGIHQGNWAGLMGGGAGTCMFWFWAELHRVNGYVDYGPVSAMARRIPWRDPALCGIDREQSLTENPRIEAMGYTGTNGAWVWFYDNRWLPICREEFTPFANERAVLSLADGTYRARFLDTRTGETVTETTVSTEAGCLKMPMPVWEKDIALVAERI